MKEFSEYLHEAEKQPEGKKLKHLPHLEDMPLHGGHESVSAAADILDGVHKKLLGKSSDLHISTKYDGSPSLVFGTHPQNGKFFVGTKAAFNKSPKVNYTPEDIEKNHGHSPGLTKALKAALTHLPKVMPKEGGIFQGDMMYTKPEVKSKEGKYSFTPNTITYSTDKNSEHGKAIKNAKMGVVVHTKYTPPKGSSTLGSLNADIMRDKDHAKFKKHPDVHMIDPSLRPDPKHYTPEEQTAYLGHLENARAAYSRMKPESLEVMSKHAQSIESHVHDTVRKGSKPSVEGYVQHLTDKHNKDLSKLKTESIMESKTANHSAVVKEVMDNKEHFKKLFEFHAHLGAAKDVLTEALAKNTEFEHHINGIETHPEGVVVLDKKGNACKLVNRGEFSRQNFLKGGF